VIVSIEKPEKKAKRLCKKLLLLPTISLNQKLFLLTRSLARTPATIFITIELLNLITRRFNFYVPQSESEEKYRRQQQKGNFTLKIY
jgi:hypothetical protein